MDTKPSAAPASGFPKLCFGTMSFGGDADPGRVGAHVPRLPGPGDQFFRLRDAYSKGRAEEILGDLMAGERDDLVITSKCFMPTGSDVNATGASRRHVTRAVEASLERLGTDRLDVLFMHRWDPITPLEETLRGLEDLVRAGKVLYLGASNYAAWQIAKGLGISARNGWSRFDVIQPMYNLVKRQAEVEILPLAKAEDLGVITYSPVGGGLLSGKYGPDKRPEATRIMTNDEYKARYGEDWVFETAGRFARSPGEMGVHPGQPGGRLGGRHPGRHLSHHRRAQPGTAAAVARRAGGGDDARPARGDRGPVPHAAARPIRPAGRTGHAAAHTTWPPPTFGSGPRHRAWRVARHAQQVACVLICGGGVIGVSIAYYLSLRGVEAVVIERSGRRLRGVGQVGRLSGSGLVRRCWRHGPAGAAQL